MPEKSKVPPLTLKEVAPQLGLSATFVRNLCVKQLIRHSRFGTSEAKSVYRFRQEWVDEYVAAAEVPVQQGGQQNGKAKK